MCLYAFALTSFDTTLQRCRQKRHMDVQAALAEHMLMCIANPQAKSGQLCSVLFLSFFPASCSHPGVSQMCVTDVVNETSKRSCIHAQTHTPDCAQSAPGKCATVGLVLREHHRVQPMSSNMRTNMGLQQVLSYSCTTPWADASKPSSPGQAKGRMSACTCVV